MARSSTNTTPTLVSKPCDVEYRVRRLEVLTEKALAALGSIDPDAVAEGTVARGLELLSEFTSIVEQISNSKPAKRSYGKAEKAEKPAKKTRSKRSAAEEPTTLDEALADAEGELDIAAE